MSAFTVFKERREMRLKKYPELQHLWNGQTAVITHKERPTGSKLRVNPAPRPCSVLVSVDGGGGAPMEWLELENALRALSGVSNA